MLPALDLSIGQRLNFPSKYIYSENKTTSFFSPMEFSMLWHTTSKINNLHEVFLKACSSSKHVWSSGLTFPYGLAWFCWLSPERNMFEKICLLVTVRGPHDTNVWESATQFVFPPLTSSPEKLAAETLLVFLSNFFFFFTPFLSDIYIERKQQIESKGLKSRFYLWTVEHICAQCKLVSLAGSKTL